MLNKLFTTSLVLLFSLGSSNVFASIDPANQQARQAVRQENQARRETTRQQNQQARQALRQENQARIQATRQQNQQARQALRQQRNNP